MVKENAVKMPVLKRKCETRMSWRAKAQKFVSADFESNSPRASEIAAPSAAEGSMLSAEGLRDDEGEIPLYPLPSAQSLGSL